MKRIGEAYLTTEKIEKNRSFLERRMISWSLRKEIKEKNGFLLKITMPSVRPMKDSLV